MLGVHAYEGTFLALPLIQAVADKRKRRKAGPIGVAGELEGHYPIKMHELVVADMVFLYGTDQPALAVLHEGNMSKPAMLSTYQVISGGGAWELQEWEHNSRPLEQEAKMLIPVPEPLGGVVVIGDRKISYWPVQKDGLGIFHLVVEASRFVSWGMIDTQRFLLSDGNGNLSLLFLELDSPKQVREIKIETIGQVGSSTPAIYGWFD